MPKLSKNRDLLNKGCNCKRSGCLKNYCECYEAKIPCSSNCKCLGCRNLEDRLDIDPIVDIKRQADELLLNDKYGTVNTPIIQPPPYPSMSLWDNSNNNSNNNNNNNNSNNNNNDSNKNDNDNEDEDNFLSDNIIEAIVKCLIAQAEECKMSGNNIISTERLILEEFGRCLENVDEILSNNDSD